MKSGCLNSAHVEEQILPININKIYILKWSFSLPSFAVFFSYHLFLFLKQKKNGPLFPDRQIISTIIRFSWVLHAHMFTSHLHRFHAWTIFFLLHDAFHIGGIIFFSFVLHQIHITLFCLRKNFHFITVIRMFAVFFVSFCYFCCCWWCSRGF